MPRLIRVSILAVVQWLLLAPSTVSQTAEESWPYHLDPPFLDDQPNDSGQNIAPPTNERYEKFMTGCYEYYGRQLCLMNEKERLERNRNQPGLQTNFTSTGYTKMAVSAAVVSKLGGFWNDNYDQELHAEAWSRGDVSVNHWESPTQFLPLATLEKVMVEDEVEKALSRWIGGKELTPSLIHGIRVYQEGSIIAPTVDRLPLVVSAIINVAQEVDEDWPVELLTHDGDTIQVYIHPGEMLLYEGHSIAHGCPYPLKGHYAAYIHVHFEPVGYTQQFQQEQSSEESPQQSLAEKYKAALAQWDRYEPVPGPKLPAYISPDSQEAVRWRQEFVFEKEKVGSSTNRKETTKGSSKTPGATTAHYVAAHGGLKDLVELGKADPSTLHQSDVNGWKPIHEAARSGHTDLVKYLLEQGAEVNARTNNGKGATPLWWAEHMLPKNHPTVSELRRQGAISIGPGEAVKVKKDDSA